ncbi:hypothetical protein LPUS_09967 [Lasallia pustulata]|uniref:Rhodopsin domain-containing protein n=1 Tax=Lasallia pustulata TaxID=136370 RepID=A0A1W5D8H9_9LECA|nr:hypothetical protein LPUS_09967 [Lasallia pustulata]
MAQRSGLGTHMWDIKLKTFFRLLYLENISSILYGINVCLIKTSILLQYQRIFVIHKTRKSPMFVAIQSCIWTIFLFYLIETFFEIFQCSPREKIWNKLLTGGHCNNSSAGFKVTGVFNSISDFALLSIPMPALWKLQMPLKRKLLTMGVFAVGVLACVASIIRAYYTWVVARAIDESYSLVVLSFCAAAELAIGIIVGSLPIMPKFFQHASVKVSKALSFASNSAIKSGQESEGIRNAPTANALTSIKRSFAKYKAGSDVTESWSDQYYSRAEHHGEYLTLTEFDASSLQGTDSVQPRSLGGGTATRREDLEYGPHTS